MKKNEITATFLTIYKNQLKMGQRPKSKTWDHEVSGRRGTRNIPRHWHRGKLLG